MSPLTPPRAPSTPALRSPRGACHAVRGKVPPDRLRSGAPSPSPSPSFWSRADRGCRPSWTPSCSGGGGGFCSASKPPSPSRERRGTERAKPTSTDELVAGHPNVSTDLLLLSLPTKWRQRRALKRGREARRPIKTRFRATRPMIRGPPPVAGARRGRGRGVGCGRRFEILPERSMSGITAAVPVAGPLQGPG